MTKEARPKLSKRDKKRLTALVNADKALYELWKQSEVGSTEALLINSLQDQHIHPAIKKLEGR